MQVELPDPLAFSKLSLAKALKEPRKEGGVAGVGIPFT